MQNIENSQIQNQLSTNSIQLYNNHMIDNKNKRKFTIFNDKTLLKYLFYYIFYILFIIIFIISYSYIYTYLFNKTAFIVACLIITVILILFLIFASFIFATKITEFNNSEKMIETIQQSNISHNNNEFDKISELSNRFSYTISNDIIKEKRKSIKKTQNNIT